MSLYDLKIPKELIAQYPKKYRDKSKVMKLSVGKQKIEHFGEFKNIVSLFKKGDLLVLNDTKVINARFFTSIGNRKIEVLILENFEHNIWMCMLGGKLKDCNKLSFIDSDYDFEINIISHIEKSLFKISFPKEIDVFKFLKNKGSIPLPPYIKRLSNKTDNKMYQTVFAKHMGSLASPTASLHFTKDILNSLKLKGVNITYLTLHVSYGTFSKVENIDTHKMHSENYFIGSDLIEIINKTKKK